jgi:hypothetical protein
MVRRLVPPTPAEMADHVVQLARAFGIGLMVHEDDRSDAAAVTLGVGPVQARVVMVRRVTDDTSYAIALHEFGHFLHPTGTIGNRTGDMSIELKILEEESAWEWAFHHALDWTPGMEQAKEYGLSTYYQTKAKQERDREATRRKVKDFLKRTGL